MKKTVFTFCLFICLIANGQYYVTTSGNSSNDGLSEANAWSLSHAFATAVAGDIVHIKAGDYGSGNYTISTSGTTSNPITFKGYDTTINDVDTVDGTPRAYTYLDDVDSTTYPTLIGTFTSNKGVGTAIDITGTDIVFENFDIKYYESPFKSSGDRNRIKNVFTYHSGNFNATDVAERPFVNASNGGYQGKGMSFSGDDIEVINCIATDHGAEAIKFSDSDNAYGNGNRVYGGVVANTMDYHYLLAGDALNGTHENIYVERVGTVGNEPDHFGHGIVLKCGTGYTVTGNVIKNSTVINTFLELQFPFVSNNTCENITLIREADFDGFNISGGIMLKNGSHDNNFKNIYIYNSSVWFLDQTDGLAGDVADSSDDNTFENLVIENYKAFSAPIVFGHINDTEPTLSTDNNEFYNCTFSGGAALFKNNSENTGTLLKNCVIDGISALTVSVSGQTTYPINITYEDSNFSNGFTAPSGTNITTYSPLFTGTGVDAEEFELQSGSLLKDAGATITGLTTDFNGDSYLNSPPIGAFEYGGTVAPPIVETELILKQKARRRANNIITTF